MPVAARKIRRGDNHGPRTREPDRSITERVGVQVKVVDVPYVSTSEAYAPVTMPRAPWDKE